MASFADGYVHAVIEPSLPVRGPSASCPVIKKFLAASKIRQEAGALEWLGSSVVSLSSRRTASLAAHPAEPPSLPRHSFFLTTPSPITITCFNTAHLAPN
ncbi:hypothetical protein PMIN06_000009 [Paraphaeosphaeria minitans]